MLIEIPLELLLELFVEILFNKKKVYFDFNWIVSDSFILNFFLFRKFHIPGTLDI